MGNSREASPDWLRCFQPPTSAATLVLSSDSEPSGDGIASSSKEDLSLSRSHKISDDDDENLGKILGGDGAKSPTAKKSTRKSPRKGLKLEDEASPGKNKSVNRKKRKVPKSSVLMLSSDSELSAEEEARVDRETSEQMGEAEEKIPIDSDDEALAKRASRDRAPKTEPETLKKEEKKGDIKQEGSDGKVEATEEEAPEKQVRSRASSARLPLVLSDKVQRTKALVECEGDSIDLGGDMGSVGRVVISENLSGDQEMYLDLKGTIYKTTIVPSRTFCVVSFGQTEAKVEAIMNDFIQLKPQSNVYEAETMVEGTLDGFSFESDEEDKAPKSASHKTDDNEDGEAKPSGKRKVKSEKTSGTAKKRAKSVGGKSQPQKKGKKKAQATKKTKTKK